MARKVNTSDSNITDGGKSAGANKNETITSTKTKSNQTVTGKRNGSKSVQTEPVDYFKAPNPIWYIIMLPPIIYCTVNNHSYNFFCRINFQVLQLDLILKKKCFVFF